MTFFSRVTVLMFGLCAIPAAHGEASDIELAVQQGKVLVNHGQGFIADTFARPGDLILLGDRAAASLVYPQGCFVALPAAEIFQVPAQAPCTAGAVVGAAGPDFAVPAATSGGSAKFRRGTTNPGPAVVAAAAVVTGAAASLPVWRVNDTNTPASAP